MTYHINRLRVTNYRGIQALDTPIADGGMLIVGANGGGKTSVVRAIRAALAGQDIGDDAIRIGHDRAEILVDIDHHTVRRVITASGSKVTVEGPDGSPKRTPQKWLTELLGASPLDPLELFAAPPRERRRQILAALPVRISRAQIEAALPAWAHVALEVDYDRHGLDVIADLRDRFAGERKVVAAAGKTRRAELEAAREAVKAAPGGGEPGDVGPATAALEEARRAHAEMIARVVRVGDAKVRHAGTRARIADLRARADEVAAATPPPEPGLIEGRQREVDACRTRLDALRLQLAAAERDIAKAQGAVDAARAIEDEQAAARRDVATWRAQADDLERTVEEGSEAEPTEDERREAGARVLVAEANLTTAQGAAKRAALFERAREVEVALHDYDEREGRLNGVIDTLTKALPSKLLADSNGIPGLALSGDDILLDGVSILGLSGREQLLFAVDVARRANAVAKLLIVDGLERIDPDMMPEFLERATAGGYQLIATRVDRGDVQLVMIGKDDGKAGA